VCDWNVDGRLDLVTGERNGFLTLFLRDSAGGLANAGRIQARGVDIQTNNNSWPFVCDWNEDGRKDLLVGQEGISQTCNVFVYLNQGTDTLPLFSDSTPVLWAGVPISSWRAVPLVRDLDNDGYKDLILGEWYSSIRLYHNYGTNPEPLFLDFDTLVTADPDSFLNGNPPRIALCDWDGDTRIDMVTCDYYGSVFLRRNVTPTAVAELPGLAPVSVEISPNPATGAVRFAWPGAAARRVSVYDGAGRLVRDFVSPAGSGLSWDLCDRSGRSVAAGIYLARVETTAGSSTDVLVVK
jgi:hypothetical protein